MKITISIMFSTLSDKQHRVKRTQTNIVREKNLFIIGRKCSYFLNIFIIDRINISGNVYGRGR